MKTTTFIFAVLSALAVQADYLYWMVDTDTAADFSSQYTAVRLTDGSNVYDSYTGITHSDIVAYQGSGYYFTAENLSPAFSDSTSYFVELYNGGTTVATSSAITGADLRSMMAYYSGGMSIGAATPASFGGFTSAVPEPTSGLLFLVGGMLLGLKRRRQQL